MVLFTLVCWQRIASDVKTLVHVNIRYCDIICRNHEGIFKQVNIMVYYVVVATVRHNKCPSSCLLDCQDPISVMALSLLVIWDCWQTSGLCHRKTCWVQQLNPEFHWQGVTKHIFWEYLSLRGSGLVTIKHHFVEVLCQQLDDNWDKFTFSNILSVSSFLQVLFDSFFIEIPHAIFY